MWARGRGSHRQGPRAVFRRGARRKERGAHRASVARDGRGEGARWKVRKGHVVESQWGRAAWLAPGCREARVSTMRLSALFISFALQRNGSRIMAASSAIYEGERWADSLARFRSAMWCWTSFSAWTTTLTWARAVRAWFFARARAASRRRFTPSRIRRSALASIRT